MPAHSEDFPWPSYYGVFRYFEANMARHNKVIRFSDEGDGLFELQLDDGRNLKVFVCECYSFGIAEYEEVIQHHGRIDAVVVESNWCGYTPEVKDYCKNVGVGVFKTGHLMGAINLRNIAEYVSHEEREAERHRRHRR